MDRQDMNADIQRIREHCEEALEHDISWWAFRDILMMHVEKGDRFAKMDRKDVP